MRISKRCGNSIGPDHVCQLRVKNCKASHEIDDNAWRRERETFILTQNLKYVFAIARAPWGRVTVFRVISTSAACSVS